MVDERLRHRAYTREVGDDPADIRDWTWPAVRRHDRTNRPLGVIDRERTLSRTAIRLGHGDRLLIHSDAIAEAATRRRHPVRSAASGAVARRFGVRAAQRLLAID